MQDRRRWLIAGYVALLGVTGAVSAAAWRWDRFAGDLWLTERMQGWPEPAGALSEATRTVTGTDVVVMAGLAVAVRLAFVAGLRRVAATVALVFVTLPVVQAAVKDLVDRPRPPTSAVDVRGSATSASFPAGHVMSGTVLLAVIAVAVWLSPMRRSLRFAGVGICGLLAVVGGFANVYEGVHWPSDVAGGWLWAGVLLGPFAWLISKVR